ncbi:MAG: bifunctional histidinol-phosphatase/imidazoleglycerol-phosphate dehydratase HisB [Flavobacteriaceae bacterium]
MKKYLFVDRDGTIIKEPADYQIDHIDKLVFFPNVISSLRLAHKVLGYQLVLITNQDGLGTESFPSEDFWPVQNLMIRTLESEGISFEKIAIDSSFPSENSPNRKPRTGMLMDLISQGFDLENSFVIGDRYTDVELGKNLGIKSFLFNASQSGKDELNESLEELNNYVALECDDWNSITDFLKKLDRKITHQRKTKETDIEITLNLEGTGESEINTGLGFFDHMLEQIARHGQLDLFVKCKGDLHIDEHHTIEDTGIALGEAFAKALGNKLGVERYGYCLPMDDALAQAAIDFGGRAWLMWDAKFKREKIGDMPTEMFFHFFKSFADGAKANLNLKASGFNEHHKIEGLFKAFAKAIKMAKKRDTEHLILPSTKGSL